MQVKPDLNLAFPIRYAETSAPDPQDPKKTVYGIEPLVWAYHTPVSREVFEAHHRVLCNTYAALWANGTQSAATIAKSGTAGLLLKDVAEADAEQWGLAQSSGPAILEEIKRLTHVLAPGPNGFRMLPVDIAIKEQVIDVDDWSEGESAIVFFTCSFWATRKAIRLQQARAHASVVGASLTSLPPMEFAGSLQTSTPEERSQPPA